MKFLIFLVVVTFVTLCFFGLNGSPGAGEKTGQIVKLDNRGMFFKTWEGEILRGGMNAGSGAVGTIPFYFTIEDEEMVKQVQHYIETQQEVIITYRMEGIYEIVRSNSHGTFLVSVRPANNTKPVTTISQ